MTCRGLLKRVFRLFPVKPADREGHLALGQKVYPKWNPGKWKHGLNPAVPWWFNFDPYPSWDVNFMDPIYGKSFSPYIGKPKIRPKWHMLSVLRICAVSLDGCEEFFVFPPYVD